MCWTVILVATAVSAIVTFVLAPLFFSRLKRMDERQKRSSEMRHSDYKKHLKLIEEIVTKIQEFFDPLVIDLGNKRGGGSGKLENQLKYIDDVVRSTQIMKSEFAKPNSELRSFQLVCSDQLNHLIDAFLNNQKELFSIISEFQILESHAIPKSLEQISHRIVERVKQNTNLFDSIRSQMRSDLGLADK